MYDGFSKRFLLIDDDTDDRALFSEALATVDPVAICDHATDGAEAFDRLNRKELAEPDIIFLDINMPVMNGWQFLRKLKSEEAYKHIPVIVYSTSSSQRDRRTADDLGALCFVTKPDAFRVLRAMLGVVVGHVRRRSFDAICPELKALKAS
jgi:CheY-like chemotaxis protein